MQISTIIRSGGSFGSWLANLEKKITRKCCYSSNLPGLESNLTSSVTNKFDKKISKKEMSECKKRRCQSTKRIYFIYFE